MCYGSGCMFENHMGDCQVHMSHTKFKEKYGYGACAVGRSIQDEDDKEFYETHKEELDKVYCQYREDRDREFKKFVEEFSS